MWAARITSLVVVLALAIASGISPAEATRSPALHQESCVAGTTFASGSLLFLQRDPEGYRDSVNLYAGMAWDTVNNRDPTGRLTSDGDYEDREECLAAYPGSSMCADYSAREKPSLFARFRAWIRAKGADAGEVVAKETGRQLVARVADLGNTTVRRGAMEEFDGRAAAAGRSGGADLAKVAIEAAAGKGLGAAAGPLLKLRKLAKKTGEEEFVDLYRAVGPGEFDDIFRARQFRAHPGGRSLAAKQFGHDLDEEVRLADFLPNTAAVVRTRVPKRVFDKLDHTPVDPSILRSGTTTVQPEKLDWFNRALLELEQVF